MRRLLILTTSFCAPISLASAQDVDFRKISGRDIQHLAIEVGLGHVEIEGAANSNTIEVRTSRFSTPELCEFTIEQHEKQLRMVARTKSPQTMREQCKLNIKLKAPRTVSFDVKVGNGALLASGIEGSVHFDIGTGDIALSALKTRNLTGRAGTGDVIIKGQIDQTTLRVGAGDVRITYEQARPGVPAGNLDIKVGSGSTTVLLPEHSQVRTSFRSGSGSLTSEFPHLNHAKFTISGSSGTGDLFVRKL